MKLKGKYKSSKPLHESCCAVHNEPAMKKGKCNCSVSKKKK